MDGSRGFAYESVQGPFSHAYLPTCTVAIDSDEMVSQTKLELEFPRHKYQQVGILCMQWQTAVEVQSKEQRQNYTQSVRRHTPELRVRFHATALFMNIAYMLSYAIPSGEVYRTPPDRTLDVEFFHVNC